MKKSIGEIIDELTITNIKIALILEKGYTDLSQPKKVQELNKYRSELKNAINEYYNERQEVKTYE